MTATAMTAERRPTEGRPSVLGSLAPLAIDVLLPLLGYAVLRIALGASVVTALTVSSVVPLARSVLGFVRDGTPNTLAMLILTVNLASIALTLVSGNPRVILAKNSGLSAIIALGMIASVWRGRPVTTPALVPWITRNNPARAAAFTRLSAASTAFRALERRYCLLWGFALLTECVLRIVGAFTLAPSTMGWLSDVLLAGALAFAITVGGAITVEPMDKLVEQAIAA